MTTTSSSELTIRDLVRVEEASTGHYVGRPQRTGRDSVFGGQLTGQALAAAAHTAGRYGWATSMHVYFIAAPDPGRPLAYEVVSRRDGGRYAWRNVQCRQDGDLVLEAMACFQDREPTASPWPVPDGTAWPEDLPRLDDLARDNGPEFREYSRRLGASLMDARFVQGPPPLRLLAGDQRPVHQLWLRPQCEMTFDPLETACCLAYMSDVNMLASPLLVVGRLGDGVKDFASTFDHTIRFYGALITDEWLLYHQSTAVVAGTTLEAHGVMATRDGRLLLTASQQGLALTARKD